MQPARTNPERSEATRTALLDAARALFVAHGYGDTATPAVCAAAGMTRGALYHHFVDKRDLFHAVVAREAEAVAAEIDAASPADLPADQALLAGGDAYLAAMAVPGRARLLLVEGPAALGREAMQALDAANAEGTLRAGLVAAGVKGVDLDVLTGWLSAAFDRAALDLQEGRDVATVRRTLRWLLGRILPDGPPGRSTRRAKA
ncbi:TetR/AcrR family transcriptional regulator [Piscinibacter sp. HJYY11]|uniref:TetR/AcrR family transcriptional regulator n=1 Tax=Piscinibacter sp. HJYY11 TaxID=2801333 RepID=UPI00191EAAD6|nr:TetR/AcrR family transcriptional regulator [Piscinibacter sp. HJYY11]MBL0727479.1 TetR/AcrR family transcriptional regulator [Piscinibacter sp. HJYY11]